MINPKDILIGIDDGHGYYNETGNALNPGKRTPKYPDGHIVLENQFNKPTSLFFQQACIRHGFPTILLAPEDTNVPLKTRTYRARKARCKIVYSFHFNAFKGIWEQTKGGVSTHYQKGNVQGQKLANCTHKYLIQGTTQINRGVVASNFAMTRDVGCPSVLIEAGFMDVRKEADLMLLRAFQQETAEQAIQGLCEYMGIKYIPISQKTSSSINNKEGDIDIMDYNLKPICQGRLKGTGGLECCAEPSNKARTGVILKKIHEPFNIFAKVYNKDEGNYWYLVNKNPNCIQWVTAGYIEFI